MITLGYGTPPSSISSTKSAPTNTPPGFCGIMSSSPPCATASAAPATTATSSSPSLHAEGPFGLFCDFMDGKVARWRKKPSMMGQELDFLAGLISFSVTPAVSALAVGMRTPLDHMYRISCVAHVDDTNGRRNPTRLHPEPKESTTTTSSTRQTLA